MTEEADFGNIEIETDSVQKFIDILKRTTSAADINIFTHDLLQIYSDFEYICSEGADEGKQILKQKLDLFDEELQRKTTALRLSQAEEPLITLEN
jgi:hypothetical protein